MSHDPSVEIVLANCPMPRTGADATEALTAAAEVLAHIQPITVGEARILLRAISDEWSLDHSPVEKVAGWASLWSQAIQHDATATADGSLKAHLGDQAAGRYALTPWPWPILTEQSRSLMPGSVTLVCGTPGSAKSWFILSCLRYWTTHGIPASVLMLEETTKWHLQRALAQCAADANLLMPEWIAANRDYALGVYNEHKDEISRIRSRLTCEGDWTMAKCAEWVEAQCDAGARVIVVDPISLADNGNEKPWDADRRFMARAKVAIEKSGASLILVTHPRKASGGQKAAGPPQLDDLAGGAAYGRACASTLWLSAVHESTPVRIIDHEQNVREVIPHKMIRIMKARNSIGCGKAICYRFSDLQFNEQGALAGAEHQEQPATKTQSHRAAKLRAKPNPSEDLFKESES